MVPGPCLSYSWRAYHGNSAINCSVGYDCGKSGQPTATCASVNQVGSILLFWYSNFLDVLDGNSLRRSVPFARGPSRLRDSWKFLYSNIWSLLRVCSFNIHIHLTSGSCLSSKHHRWGQKDWIAYSKQTHGGKIFGFPFNILVSHNFKWVKLMLREKLKSTPQIWCGQKTFEKQGTDYAM